MPQVKYIESDGTEHLIDVPVGSSLMQGAVRNGVPGIDGDCGGACSCATCHVYIVEAWRDKIAPATEGEASMLEFVKNFGSNSRLACQINVSDELDGIEIHLPESQY